ncbi:hypothetical protein FHX37_2414 [Haloactinospora alba]|uniref:Uncharacterized protein n=1 Tax=Haloactinospora alba TaxID=405555 RepID=A0A543NKW9_9ACTN|nr:hypothetical protein [Haloactinospora alba]TQN32454.1 hypothetical protein FHX37_2414 [Haloactinospora alba]
MGVPPPEPAHGPQPDMHGYVLSMPFPVAAPQLRVALTGDPSSLGTEMLAYSVNPHLTALVCYQTQPSSYEAMVLDKRYLQAWGVSKQDVWFTALRNMAQDPVDGQTYQTTADTPVHVVHGLTWPGSAHVMRLAELAREPLPYGAIVMLPDPNVLVYAVLRSKRSIPLLPFLYQTFRSLDRGEAITDQMIWWRGGKLSCMPTRSDPAGGLQLQHTDEFSAMLERELPP